MRHFGRVAHAPRRALHHHWNLHGRRPHFCLSGRTVHCHSTFAGFASSPEPGPASSSHTGPASSTTAVTPAPPSSSSSSGRGPWGALPRLCKPTFQAGSDDYGLSYDGRCYYHTSFVRPGHPEALRLPDALAGPDSPGSQVGGDGRPSYQFTHGAHGIPKTKQRTRISPPLSALAEDEMVSVGCGEDAYFCRHDSLGVADGVGGWEGVRHANPALFSRKLMHYAYTEVEKYENIDDYEFVHYYDINPVDILRKSYTRVLEDAYVEGIRGSSTACLAILRDDELRVANLGDCGLAIVRHGEFVFRTEEQQHSFNFPYQIGTGCADRPEDAQVFTVKVQKGDIILLASDGLFDNLFDEDILDEIQRHVPYVAPPTSPPPQLVTAAEPVVDPVPRTLAFLKSATGLAAAAVASVATTGGSAIGTPGSAATPATSSKLRGDPLRHINPQTISAAIAQRARAVSEESRFTTSPFQNRAIQEGFYHQGGKPDDITVLVAVVADLEDSPDRR
ncbi:hypothetical protein IWQ60_005052 [Tieghemiomyces parasiticus]|uniref:Protein phosphatase n=1 Tax=Tieghemiomyces parasiticus TaxID=78921 RepID=A0A9W8DUY7_9FUNG|nr:hypothetical protein IWQ60_005052 [Tieghemiomyces parasiticus]